MRTLSGLEKLAKLESLLIINFGNHLHDIQVSTINVTGISRLGLGSTMETTIAFSDMLKQKYETKIIHDEDLKSMSFHTLPQSLKLQHA